MTSQTSGVYLGVDSYLENTCTIGDVQCRGRDFRDISARGLDPGHDIPDGFGWGSVMEVVVGDDDFEVVWLLSLYRIVEVSGNLPTARPIDIASSFR